MRDCIFLLADAEMKAAFEGFLSRPNFHLSLGTSPFKVDLRKDIIHDAQGKYPGIYTRAHELLRPYVRTHSHGIIVLDNAWDGSPGLRISGRISAPTWYVQGGRKTALLSLSSTRNWKPGYGRTICMSRKLWDTLPRHRCAYGCGMRGCGRTGLRSLRIPRRLFCGPCGFSVKEVLLSCLSKSAFGYRSGTALILSLKGFVRPYVNGFLMKRRKAEG